jgi:hypothetical protein
VQNEPSAQAQRVKPKPNVDLLLGKAVRQCAELGYRLIIEKIREPETPPATISVLEDWKRKRDGGA